MPLTERPEHADSSSGGTSPSGGISLLGTLAAAGLLGALAGGVEGLVSVAFGVGAYGQSAVARNLKLDFSIVPFAVLFDAIAWMLAAIVLSVLALITARIAKRPGAGQTSVLPVVGALTIITAGAALVLKLRATGRMGSVASLPGILLPGATAVAAIAGVVALRRSGRRPLAALAARPRGAAAMLVVLLAAARLALFLAAGDAEPGRMLPWADEAARGGRPNILLVVLDTVRADRCSAYGHSAPTTPALAALASEGTLFENAMSPAIWTVAGHASLFTGLYPGSHRADRERPILMPEFRTLAERLAESGYVTGAFSGNPWVSPDNGIARGFEGLSRLMLGPTMSERQREQLAVRNLMLLVKPLRSKPVPEVDAEDVAAEANHWLDRRRGDPRPFFMFVNFFDAHWPYEPSGPRLSEFIPADVSAEERVRLGTLPASDLDFGERRLTEREQQIVRGLYDGDLARADRGLGLLIDRMRADGLLESTVVAVTSDHGEMLGEHGKHGHDLAIYQPLLHVPLVVRWPARFPAGVRETKLVQTHDLYPTLLDLAGLTRDSAERTGGGALPAPDAPCRPLFPETLAAAPRALAFSDESRPLTTLARLGETFPGRDFSAYDREMRAVTDGRYKAIVMSDGERHLYDLLADPGEENDLALVEPDRLALLAAAIEARRLSEAAAIAGKTTGKGTLEDLPPEMLDQLRSLGYIK